MQADLPKTGHIWVDAGIYIAIGIITLFKGLAFLREKGVIPPAKPAVSKEQTQMMRTRGGFSGDRSTELWDYKIAEIIDKQLSPCKELLEEQAKAIATNRDAINRILAILENRPRR